MEQVITSACAILGLVYCVATTVWIWRGMPDTWLRPWGVGRRRTEDLTGDPRA